MSHAFTNPFRPGAGHAPPYLAGRDDEQNEVRRALGQTIVLENIILTGLRGVGKTVLLETFKPIAQGQGWLWIGQDMSEAASSTEANMAERLITDLALLTSTLLVSTEHQRSFGFVKQSSAIQRPVGYTELRQLFDKTPGLLADKLKAVLSFVWKAIPPRTVAGIVFAYDEAQNLADHRAKEQFPLSVLLDVFASLQKQEIPYLLILAGLPTLFPKLVEARTYSERMFHIIFLSQLTDAASRDAIVKPIEDQGSTVSFDNGTVEQIIRMSGGYPYFIQFICKEIFDAWSRKAASVQEKSIPLLEIERKLDNDFFSGRWANATDRQRQLMHVIAQLPTCNTEFSVQEAVSLSKERLVKSFSPSQTNQMLASLSASGLVFKNRHGKYCFAVPLLSAFIRRQQFDPQ